MAEKEKEIVELLGEDGEKIPMKIYEFVTLEGRDYVLLQPLEDNEDNRTIIMKVNETEDDSLSFEMIEDDEEFKAVVNALNDEGEEE